MTKEEAKRKIAELVAKYESLSQSEIKGYNEAATKLGFIEPMFRALGWNVEDKNEVAPEDKVSSGRVDYAFKLHGVSQFYLEAKPPRADLTKLEYAKQAVTYAYNKGVSWAILSDFERLIVFIAQTGKPFINLTFDKYLTDFDDLWLLSKESFQENALAKKAEKYGALPLHIPIETRLLKRLLQWREELYNQLHAHNENLSFAQIDEVIQRLFDRLIFIRTCEDRNLEEKRLLAAANQWKSAGHKGELIEELQQIFELYRDTYDSELFDEHLTDEVFIEGSTIESILTGLYEIPGSLASYDFNDIGVDVLGIIYEQYLGYVATKVKERVKTQLKLGLTDEETFEIISKKQRRKELGIYYTPKFVTDYIVKETVGRFIKEHNYNETRTIKILDPACGSGSFLIRAYDELLSYHARERNISLDELDQKDRLPVLLTNIYGVDLDMQAIEITRLNLLLRTLSEKGKLPYLSNNIRRGNSLISGKEEELKKYFGDNWREKNPFNWEQEFKDIMANGGFHIVIGNPPWVSLSGKHKSQDLSDGEFEYLFDTFDINTYAPNIYEVFIWRALDLLKEDGLFSFIIPDRLATNQQFVKLREFILLNFRIEKILFRYPFPGVIADTMIIVLRKAKPKDNKIEITDYSSQKSNRIPQSAFLSSSDFSFFFVDSKIARIFQEIKESKKVKRLDTIAESTSGCGAKSSLLQKRRASSREIRVMKGENIGRYETKGSFWFDFKDENLTGRTRDKSKLGMQEKVLIRKTGSDIIATFDNTGIYPEQSLYFLYGVSQEMLLYLLAILNSKLMNMYYRNFAVTNRDTTPQLKNIDLDKFPIVTADKKGRDKLAVLVEKMLELNKKLAPIRDKYCNERDELLKEIEQTDKEIDNLIYDLYGLTEEERKIVETV
jgi:type I restriction-modification system DNA methylase subunit